MDEDDLKQEIRRLLDLAMEKHGPSIQLRAIENSWATLSTTKKCLKRSPISAKPARSSMRTICARGFGSDRKGLSRQPYEALRAPDSNQVGYH